MNARMSTSSSADGTPLETVLLRTFVEIVDSGSFASAADRLALTPSAVSGHMRRLEQIAGASLLARTTRRLELTQAGDTLYAYSRNILDLESEARAAAHSCGKNRWFGFTQRISPWLPANRCRWLSSPSRACTASRLSLR
jgi:DNA-binding transcriptional LysR family regulator